MFGFGRRHDPNVEAMQHHIDAHAHDQLIADLDRFAHLLASADDRLVADIEELRDAFSHVRSTREPLQLYRIGQHIIARTMGDEVRRIRGAEETVERVNRGLVAITKKLILEHGMRGTRIARELRHELREVSVAGREERSAEAALDQLSRELRTAVAQLQQADPRVARKEDRIDDEVTRRLTERIERTFELALERLEHVHTLVKRAREHLMRTRRHVDAYV